MYPHRRPSPLACLVAAVLAIGVVGCGDDSGADGAASGDTAATETSRATAMGSSSDPDGAFPVTVENCDTQFTLDAPPQRVVLIEPYAASMLYAVGSIDAVVARVGSFPEQYYEPDLLAQLDEVPELTSDSGATGGVEISLESILDLEPDLVIGYETETITRDRLAELDIDLYIAPPYCDSPPPVSFESIAEEVRLFGEMFGTTETAEAAADELDDRIAAAMADPAEDGTTAAALYVSSQGPPLYAYSSLGMVHPLMEAMGLTNVFSELPERVPEISIEEIVDRNPEVLILLHPDPDVDEQLIVDAVVNAPGAMAIDAVADGRVYPMLFNFAEPPSPIVVDGLDVLRSLLGE